MKTNEFKVEQTTNNFQEYLFYFHGTSHFFHCHFHKIYSLYSDIIWVSVLELFLQLQLLSIRVGLVVLHVWQNTSVKCYPSEVNSPERVNNHSIRYLPENNSSRNRRELSARCSCQPLDKPHCSSPPQCSYGNPFRARFT